MTDGGLTPAQARVMAELFAPSAPRPGYDRGLGPALREQLEVALRPVALSLPGRTEVYAGKGTLERVLGCEAHHLANEEEGFAWTPATAAGVVAHKAVELSVGHRGDVPPAGALVDEAIGALDHGLRDFVEAATPAELAELRVVCTEHVQTLLDSIPPLKQEWSPRLEFKLEARLCDERIVVSGKPDLGLGKIKGDRAQVLIIDFKTGRPWQGHMDDLRLYALLQTLRFGVPPWRVATFYLASGDWRMEDVTEDSLLGAVRRVVDGVTRIAELKLGREPTISPGPACGYCPLRAECAGSDVWREQREARGELLEV